MSKTALRLARQAGRVDRAITVIGEMLEADPHFTVSDAVRTHPYKDKAVMDVFTAALREAGLPQGER